MVISAVDVADVVEGVDLDAVVERVARSLAVVTRRPTVATPSLARTSPSMRPQAKPKMIVHPRLPRCSRPRQRTTALAPLTHTLLLFSPKLHTDRALLLPGAANTLQMAQRLPLQTLRLLILSWPTRSQHTLILYPPRLHRRR